MTVEDPIVAFLRARLAEDEQAARAATPGPWWYNPGKQWLNPEAFERYDLARGEEFVGHGGPSPFTGAVAATGPASHPQSMADAAFIACHDPARMLREVKAKRKLLAEHAITNDSVCGTCVTGRWGYPAHGGSDPQAYPCRTLRLLALPFADHPDFDPAWSTA